MKDGETPFVQYIPYESQKSFSKAQVHKLLDSKFLAFHPLASLLIPLQLAKIKWYTRQPNSFTSSYTIRFLWLSKPNGFEKFAREHWISNLRYFEEETT